tara:strand:+ start:204 stop:473 length:270 start_codon:yes stop_codon:yes gene_type:complete
MIAESYEQQQEGITALACAVVEQAAKDYWKLKKGKGENVKICGAAIPRVYTMLEIERFFSEDGGAQYYLDLANSKISTQAILTRLKSPQ